ncbi:MAG TPA: hypothetical protein VKT99_09695 [Xanthobacteraceae bacterium]|jgi:hypothetical protein|nr:hypothetical protein [Xanthobacteraceae bacterium]
MSNLSGGRAYFNFEANDDKPGGAASNAVGMSLALKARSREHFFAALLAAGMPEAPEEFSVLPQHQVIPAAVLAEISDFIRAFDRVTAREAWQVAALREAPPVAQLRRRELCFFSAWDFHLPPGDAWRLIEFNDNGSGFIFAAIINALYYETAGLAQDKRIAPPPHLPVFKHRIRDFVEQEARAFFGENPGDLPFLILDDAQSLQQGKFRKELRLLRELLREGGWRAELGCPAETRWDGRRLLFKGQRAAFIINRSTDFFWQSDDFSALRTAYQAGCVYVSPNPFTYATRSDKRLLEWLSLPDWDNELQIGPAERQILHNHVPETHLLRSENLAGLAEKKQEFVFKPLHGYAGRGLLDSAAVGRTRLRRLVTKGEGYVAQRRVAKSELEIDGEHVWTDLRVWAYRGEIFHLSGRASRRPDRLDLTLPGGWLPTYALL